MDGPRGGNRDRGLNVGTHTSIAIDDQGVLHAFYRSNESDSMWYARGTGTGLDWTFETREFDTTKQSGFFADAVIIDGTLHVVYLVDNLGAPGSFKSVLRHASFPVSDAIGTLNVATQDIYEGSSSNPCGAKCAAGDQCFPVVSECLAPTSDCGTCADGTACLNGTCETTFKVPAANYKKAVGVLNELTRTPAGLLATFWDGTQNEVVAMQWNATTDAWDMPRLTPGGPYASGLVDANGDLHLAYMDVDTDTLVYENMSAGATEVIAEGIRDSTDGWMVNDIGEDVSLRQEADGSFVASFHDASRHTLKFARRSGTSWSVEDLAGRTPYTGAHGFFATMLRAPDTLLVAHFSINQQVMPGTGSVLVVSP